MFVDAIDEGGAGFDQDPTGAQQIAEEGEVTKEFVARDRAGNPATSSVAVRIDRTAPTTSITTPDQSLLVQAVDSARVTGISTDLPQPLNSGVREVRVLFWNELNSQVTPGAVTLNGGAWSAVPSESLVPGPYSVIAFASDHSGNEAFEGAWIHTVVV